MPSTILPAIDDWSDWSAIFVDEARWRPAIEALWAIEPALATDTGMTRVETVRAGYPGTCAVFILNEVVVIKFFPPMVAGDFIRERAVYRLLGNSLPELPSLLAAGVWRDRSHWPFLVTSLCPGLAWRDARATVPAPHRLAMARALGERVRRVHDAPLPAGQVWPPVDAWLRLVAGRLPAASAALHNSGVLPATVAAAGEALLRETPWFDGRPCLLHADLTEDHVLVMEQAGRYSLSGLIDWADAEVGDPVYEWVALFFGFCGRDTRLFSAFMDGYAPAGGRSLPPRRRLLAYTLLHRFGLPIIADALPEETRRQLTGLDELAGRLFPGFE